MLRLTLARASLWPSSQELSVAFLLRLAALCFLNRDRARRHTLATEPMPTYVQCVTWIHASKSISNIAFAHWTQGFWGGTHAKEQRTKEETVHVDAQQDGVLVNMHRSTNLCSYVGRLLAKNQILVFGSFWSVTPAVKKNSCTSESRLGERNHDSDSINSLSVNKIQCILFDPEREIIDPWRLLVYCESRHFHMNHNAEICFELFFAFVNRQVQPIHSKHSSSRTWINRSDPTHDATRPTCWNTYVHAGSQTSFVVCFGYRTAESFRHWIWEL